MYRKVSEILELDSNLEYLTQGGSPLGLGVVLSLGTGRQKSLKVEAVNLDMPSGVFSFFQSIETIKHLKNVFVEQVD